MNPPEDGDWNERAQIHILARELYNVELRYQKLVSIFLRSRRTIFFSRAGLCRQNGPDAYGSPRNHREKATG